MGRPKLSETVAQIQERLTRLEASMELAGIGGVRRMLTTEEAASFLGMTLDGLRGLTSKKLIPFYKPNGKNIYFDVAELMAWQRKHHFKPVGDRRGGASGEKA